MWILSSSLLGFEAPGMELQRTLSDGAQTGERGNQVQLIITVHTIPANNLYHTNNHSHHVLIRLCSRPSELEAAHASYLFAGAPERQLQPNSASLHAQ